MLAPGTTPRLLVAVGTPGFTNRRGRVWATHFGWSGDREQYPDALADGRPMLGAAEFLGPAEIVLAAGRRATRTPALFAAYSDRGMDGISEVFYSWFRSRRTMSCRRIPGSRPASPARWC